MEPFQAGLTLATFLCTLVAGFVFAFAIVVMPGIGKLNDREFLNAFQTMDRVIQNNQPAFMLLWVGSIVSLVLCCLMGVGQLAGAEQKLLIAAAVIYLAGVQLPTLAVNVPLNNQLQTLDISTLDEQELVAARSAFEARWNRWNNIRTVFACLAAVLLLLLMLRL